MDRNDPTEIVRRGYDSVSYRYRGDDDAPVEYLAWLADLRRRLPPGANVLDLGCGCGVPVARALADDGHHVTGVDISAVQVDRARRLVPTATFLRADATEVRFPEAAFDAVVCLYALIHVPLPAQPRLIGRIADWLRPGGILLATTGATAWTGAEDGWLGGDATMWWSHADAATYRAWIAGVGLVVESDEFVPEGGGGHQLFRARRPPSR
ncbi:methyltransferase domain-containing protein [Asanoa sp. WMMD1127]|uniref:class I SAM-dependent methyltransferase n=1 Tax=Asanoa sp. WMMD1127 TaxID=3016107 RepID=UPI00241753C6|nr:class I SAM-dependent methyltransferase [Asanoa sp. WMMD1127]MDG4826121.1 methyltransferase domain-containing protein [Asanoa sp. WMMD1127]